MGSVRAGAGRGPTLVHAGGVTFTDGAAQVVFEAVVKSNAIDTKHAVGSDRGLTVDAKGPGLVTDLSGAMTNKVVCLQGDARKSGPRRQTSADVYGRTANDNNVFDEREAR